VRETTPLPDFPGAQCAKPEVQLLPVAPLGLQGVPEKHTDTPEDDRKIFHCRTIQQCG